MLSYADLVGPELGRHTWVQQPAPFGCLGVEGPDAVAFAHRLCSQEVEGMQPGEARPAAFFSAKGKLETLVWVGRTADGVWLEAQEQEIDKLRQLIERYHFSERLKVVMPTDQRCEQVVGHDAWRGLAGGPHMEEKDGSVVFQGERCGLRWRRRHGGEPASSANHPALDAATWQLLRVAAGIPWLGVDADGSHLGLELDIDDHVSLTKGCYTGQEIVARIHTYGHTNRRLCRLRWGAATEVALGAALADEDGEVVGRMTSIAARAGGGGLGLALLPHAMAQPGQSLRVANAAGLVEVC